MPTYSVAETTTNREADKREAYTGISLYDAFHLSHINVSERTGQQTVCDVFEQTKIDQEEKHTGSLSLGLEVDTRTLTLVDSNEMVTTLEIVCSAEIISYNNRHPFKINMITFSSLFVDYL